MRKQVFGRHFKRDVNERKALFKSLMSALVLYGKIQTTTEKAKAIKSEVEKLVTKAKKRGKEAYRFLSVSLTPPAIKKITEDIAPLFASRNGGYTRIIKLGRRFSDSASMAIMEWVEKVESVDAPREKVTKPTKQARLVSGPTQKALGVSTGKKEKPATKKIDLKKSKKIEKKDEK